MAKQIGPGMNQPTGPKTSGPPIRYRVTIEDLQTGAITQRPAGDLRAALVMAAEAHGLVIQAAQTKQLEMQ